LIERFYNAGVVTLPANLIKLQVAAAYQPFQFMEGDMRKLRLALVTGIVILTLTVFLSSAIAASATHHSLRLTDTSTPFGFPIGEFCQEFPQPMHIESDENGSNRIKNATEVVMGNGNKKIVVTDLIRGTATDEFGGSYTYVYENAATFVFDGSTVTISMQDLFRLKGPTTYTAGFYWRWSYEADSLELIPIYDESGQLVDLQVDPNLPPTEDGVTEAPWIIPGSWQQFHTFNDPWNCDPL
jgi:hypothetical protein